MIKAGMIRAGLLSGPSKFVLLKFSTTQVVVGFSTIHQVQFVIFPTTPPTRYHDYITFLGYSVGFVATVLTLKEGHYRSQINILAFTVLALSLFVVQVWCVVYPKSKF